VTNSPDGRENASACSSRALMREADDNDWSIYLETQNERTMSFYRRMGCELVADGFEYFPGAPLTWTMWRRPGAGLARNRRRQDRAPAEHAEGEKMAAGF